MHTTVNSMLAYLVTAACGMALLNACGAKLGGTELTRRGNALEGSMGDLKITFARK